MTQAMYQKSVSHSVAQTMKNAVTAAVMTAILTIPRAGPATEGWTAARWCWSRTGGRSGSPWRPSSSFSYSSRCSRRPVAPLKLACRAGDGRAAAARGDRGAAGGGLVWPFFGSRGAVDMATLALIYVILGLGLNIVVGFAGLLDLGYVGFYAVGGYTYALLNQYFGFDVLGVPADCCGHVGAVRFRAGLPGAAAARRLPGHRHAGLR